MGVAYLMKVKKMTMKDAILFVKHKRTMDPSHDCVLQLMEFEEKLFGKGSFDKGSYKLSVKEFGGSYPSLDLSIFEQKTV